MTLARDEIKQELPPIDEALVIALDNRFPGKYPELSCPEREIWFRAGQRSLVEFLAEHFKKQHEERLGT